MYSVTAHKDRVRDNKVKGDKKRKISWWAHHGRRQAEKNRREKTVLNNEDGETWHCVINVLRINIINIVLQY